MVRPITPRNRNENTPRTNRSAILQLLLFLKQIYLRSDPKENSMLRALYIDFSKVFDKVPHQSIISKIAESCQKRGTAVFYTRPTHFRIICERSS